MSTAPAEGRAAEDEAPPLHPLLDGLVDDAALFPPASMAMTDALDAHLEHRSGPAAALLGRFLCPASRVRELLAALDGRVGEDDDILLGLVVDTGTESIGDVLTSIDIEPRLVLALVTAALPRNAPDLVAEAGRVVEVLPDVEGYVEVPRLAGWQAALAEVADSAYGARMPASGGVPGAAATERDIAEFVEMCVADEIPFTCGGGLVTAVRRREPTTGAEQHGFLNVLLATHAATQGARVEEVLQVLAETDSAALTRRFSDVDDTAAVVTRSFFLAFDGWRFDRVVSELSRLGILGAS